MKDGEPRREATKRLERPGISRKDFNKVVSAGLGILALEATGVGIVLNHGIKNSPWQESSERYPQEEALYGSEGVRLIDDIERKINVVIPLPNTFQVTNIFENNSRPPNDTWVIHELKALWEISTKLPSTFSLKEKSLLGIVRGNYSGFGGVSVQPRIAGVGILPLIVMFGPRSWETNQASSEPGIWPNLNEEFKAVFAHELTHKLTRADNELLSRYAEISGWKEEGGKWTYNGGESFIRILMEKKRHPNHEGPEEDIAVASMLYATVPNLWQRSWSSSDTNRFKFLGTTLFNGSAIWNE